MPKYGDLREDGYVFLGVSKSGERWLSPDKFRLRKINHNEKMRQWRKDNPEQALNSLHKSRGMPKPTRDMPTSCECCGGPTNGVGKLHLDHDHNTNQFRGWLCYKCNYAIGLLGDTLFGVEKAALYLKKHLQ